MGELTLKFPKSPLREGSLHCAARLAQEAAMQLVTRQCWACRQPAPETGFVVGGAAP